MKVLHIIPGFEIGRGGAVSAATSLARALSKKGIEISIFASWGNGSADPASDLGSVKVRLFPRSFLSRFWTGYSRPLAQALKEEVPHFDLVHIHEIWHYPHFAAYRAVRSSDKPFIITIHGELGPLMLGYKTIRKNIYLRFIQQKILREAFALHAITEDEARNISGLAGKGRIAHIPNGLDPEEFAALPDRSRFEELYPGIKGKRMILFLGRIHAVKGLDILSRAFGSVLKKRRDVQLVIAGPDDGYKDRLSGMLNSENAMNNVTFTGMLNGADKLAALSRAEIFVLPSYSEVLGMSTLEAMACGIPVIITRACHFPEVEESGAGKVIDADAGELAQAMAGLLDNPAACEEMGRRGKELVRARYTWDIVADRMIDLYTQVLGKTGVQAYG